MNRVWCIYELYTASTEGCKVTIEMPKREREDFLEGLEYVIQNHHLTIYFRIQLTSPLLMVLKIRHGDPEAPANKLFGVLSSTDVEKADASVPSDRENILDIVKTETGGYSQFNTTINQLIRTWVMQLIWDAARTRLEDVVDGEYDEDCADFHQRVGSLLYKLGELEIAMEMYRVELEMVEKKFGSDHPDMADPLNNIANVLKDQGKYEEALEYHKKALVVKEKEYGRDSVEVAMTLHNMGIVYGDQGEYDKAIDTYNRVLVIREEKLGPDHIKTAKTHMGIAIVLRNQKKYDEAMEKYNQVLPIYEKGYGSNSVKMATLLYNMAANLHMQGKYEDAMEKYQLSLAIREKVLGMVHQDTVRTRNNIARLQKAMQMK